MTFASLDDVLIKDVISFASFKNEEQKFQYVIPNDTLGNCLKIMSEHGLNSVPIVENYGHTTREVYKGMISSVAILNIILDHVDVNNPAENWQETVKEVLDATVQDLQQEYHIIKETDRAKLDDKLDHVIRHVFLRNGFNRICVFTPEGHASAVLSQSDIVDFFNEHPQLLGWKADADLKKLGLLNYQVVSVSDADTVIKALGIMKDAGKREVAVVDGEGRITDSLNAQAVRGLSDLEAIRKPIKEYKEIHPLQTPVFTTAAASLRGLIAGFGDALRAYIVDEAGKAQYVITLNDVLRSIVNSGWELSNVTISDICKLTNPPALQKISVDKTLGEALKKLADANLLTIPVVKGDDEYVGMVDTMDILSDLLATLEDKERGTLRENEHAASGYQHSKTDKEALADVMGKKLDCFKYTAKDIVQEDMTVQHAIQNVFLPHRYHRVTVMDKSGTKMVNVVSQKDIGRFLSKYPDILAERGEKTLEESGFLKRHVHTITMRDSMMRAFRMICSTKNRAIAVVNGQGQLVTNVSTSDLRGLNNFYHLRLSICFAKSRVPNPEDFAPDQIPMDMPLNCKSDTTLSQALNQMTVAGHRRVYIVDDSRRPISEVTLTDIFKFLLKTENTAQAAPGQTI